MTQIQQGTQRFPTRLAVSMRALYWVEGFWFPGSMLGLGFPGVGLSNSSARAGKQSMMAPRPLKRAPHFRRGLGFKGYTLNPKPVGFRI